MTASQTPVVEFSVAVKRSFKNANGEYESDFFNCVAFSKLAETISRYVRKGDLIGVEGRLQTRNYTNNEGRKIYVTEIMADNVEFLTPKKQEEQTGYEAYQNAKFEEIGEDDDIPF